MENPKSPVAEVANQPQDSPKWEGQSRAAVGRVNPGANGGRRIWLKEQQLQLQAEVQPHQLPEFAKLWERPVSEISLLLNTGNSFKHI